MKLLVLAVVLLSCDHLKPDLTCREGQRSTWMGQCPLTGHVMAFEQGEWQCRCPAKTEKKP